jgi:hypothetical protein
MAAAIGISNFIVQLISQLEIFIGDILRRRAFFG